MKNPGAGDVSGLSSATSASQITVVGRGTARVVPDIAQVTIGVQVEAPTAREASAQSAAAMRRVLDTLAAHGVERRDVRTGHVMLSPRYESSPEGPPRRVGHTATNTADVTLTAIDTVGEVIDAVVEAGGDDVLVQGVRLAVRDTSVAQVEARHAALADALAQARDIVQVMGLSLGAPLTIAPAQAGIGPRGFAAPMMQAAYARAAPTPIEAGEVEVAVELEVTFGARPVSGV